MAYLMTGPRRWLLLLGAVWALGLLVFAYVSSRTDAPTVREQSSVADARPAVDRATAYLVTDSGDAVAAVGQFAKVGGCRVSAVRDGERWERAVVLYTRAGTEPALLDRLARELPADYHARARHSGDGKVHTLRADAGSYVAVSGTVGAPGEVRLVVATGCRAASGPVPASAGQPDPVARAAVQAAFTALDAQPAGWRARAVPCPAGGALRVVEADSDPGVIPGPLPVRLSSIGPGALVAIPDVYAYRTGSVSVVVRLTAGGVLTATATTGCADP
ncbi:MAG TPA: hypothetical protein VFE14_17995 [Micromonosporaceae bacterium]|jgi:hypothetical protein|nr:hypothetical protein [Micromonosporaceae bacterium]